MNVRGRLAESETGRTLGGKFLLETSRRMMHGTSTLRANILGSMKMKEQMGALAGVWNVELSVPPSWVAPPSALGP